MKANKNLNSAKADINNVEVVTFIGERIFLLGCYALDSWNEQYIPIELMVKQAPAKEATKVEYEPLFFNLWRQKKIPNK